MAEHTSDLVVRGTPFWFTADPFLVDTPMASVEDGAVWCRAGHIVAVGAWAELRDRLPDSATVQHYPGRLISAGFVDGHTHYPQFDVVASLADDLPGWLDRHAYPAEQRCGDPQYARAAAESFCDELLRNGTTTALTFCTSAQDSVDALFAAAMKRNMRMVAGKVLMDRAGPASLLDTAERGYRESAALLRRWHGRGRNGYAITPRFAPGCTAAQLDAAGALWREHPGALLHSHIAETEDELAQVRELFPDRADYLDVYEHSGLTGPGAVFAHGVHLTEAELLRCARSGTALVHCPSSNLFLGGGLFDLYQATSRARPVTVGLGTDVAAGPTFSLLRGMRDASHVARLRGHTLDGVRGFYLATLGSATALGLADRIGSLAVGNEADLVVLDPAATPMLSRRTSRAQSLPDVLFALAVLGDDRTVEATYVAGERRYCRADSMDTAGGVAVTHDHAPSRGCPGLRPDTGTGPVEQ
ncbi:MAG TPA: guanine deaminase [Pseudonocardiaceae bacterium]|jgi:guanine deaminase